MAWSKIVCCTMKNEGPYLLEWIAYHQSIGFDGFMICSNDCTDGTNLLLNRLEAMGVIVHIENPQGPNMDPQRSAYIKIRKHPAYQEADWALVIDADEFLNVKAGDHSVQALIDACPGADAISPCWKMFGSGDQVQFAPDQLVTERFKAGSTDDKPENGLVWGFKTLFRTDKFDYMGVHRPRFLKQKPLPEAGEIKWFNGSGVDMGDRFYQKGWRHNGESYGYALAQVNHYAIKSREDFILKRLRGTANAGNNKDRINSGYWTKYDLNAVPDDTIDTSGIRAKLDELMKDADLAALQRASVDSARRTIALQSRMDDIQAFLETGQLPAPDKGKRKRRKKQEAA